MSGRIIYTTFVCTHKGIIIIKRCLNCYASSSKRTVVSILYGVTNPITLVCIGFVNRHVHFHICLGNHLFWSNHVSRTNQHTQCTEPTVEILRRTSNVSFFRVEFCGSIVTVPHQFTLTINVGNQLQVFRCYSSRCTSTNRIVCVICRSNSSSKRPLLRYLRNAKPLRLSRVGTRTLL